MTATIVGGPTVTVHRLRACCRFGLNLTADMTRPELRYPSTLFLRSFFYRSRQVQPGEDNTTRNFRGETEHQTYH